MTLYIGLLILGIMVGSVGALMGIGGGLLIVPIFLYILGFSVQQTVGTALMIVFFNSLSGTWAYMRQKKIYWPSAWRFGIATIPGAMLGSWASEYFSGNSFQIFFGLFLVCVAVNMAYKARVAGKRATEMSDNGLGRQMKLGSFCSIFVGFISSALGIGGGVIHVPLMNQVLKYPIHIAVATSTCILLISSLAGLVAHGSMGHVLWGEAICTGCGALLGAQLGANLAQRLNPRALKLAFSAMVFAIGLKFISATIF